jgi:hypothetical protein
MTCARQTVLWETCGSDPDVIRDFLELMLESVTAQIADLEAAVAADVHPGMSGLAHVAGNASLEKSGLAWRPNQSDRTSFERPFRVSSTWKKLRILCWT